MKRLVGTILAGILLSSLFVAVSASPAAAIVKIAHCIGTYEVTYDPGITNTPRDVHSTATSNYTNCTSTDPAVSSASTATSGLTPGAACVDLLQPLSSGQTTVMWNTGETTVYDWTSTAEQVGDTTVVIVAGTVVSGKFVGATVARQSTFVQQTLESQCSTSEGLTQTSGPATLTITKLL